MKSHAETSDIAKRIEVITADDGIHGFQLLVDGEPFPWMLGAEWHAEAGGDFSVPAVTLTLLAEEVEVRAVRGDE